MKDKINQFLNSNKDYSLIAALAAGLYPLLHYYQSNFTLINSWGQFIFFVFYFLLIPVICFKTIHFIFNKVPRFHFLAVYITPFLNITWFAFLLVVVTYGFNIKIISLAIFVAIVIAVFFYKYIKKIIIIQLLMSVLGTATLINYIIKNSDSTHKWMMQPDHIEQAIFKKRPNVYFIQPDGYANKAELNKGYYNFNNDAFEFYLANKKFISYSGYRSNYYSTLSSNSSMFAMKHHYYNKPKTKFKELYNARSIIVGKNPVLDVFKKNGYKTFLMLEESYLLANRPKIAYDYCNIDLGEISYFSRGFDVTKNVFRDLKNVIKTNPKTPNFFFIEKFTPSHVTNKKTSENIVLSESAKYFKRLNETNEWLKITIDLITKHDSDCIIIIAADHGGFVGMSSTLESRKKQTDKDLINSIFTAKLSIKWPNLAPEYDHKIKTSVNLFRILFTFLSEDKSYLREMQDDKSFMTIIEGAPFGVYEYIDENGNNVFNKLDASTKF